MAYRNVNSPRWGLRYGAAIAAPAFPLITNVTIGSPFAGFAGVFFGAGSMNPNPPNIIVTATDIVAECLAPPGPPDWIYFGIDTVGIQAALAAFTSVRFDSASGPQTFPVAGMTFRSPQAVGWEAALFPAVALMWTPAEVGLVRGVFAIP